MPLAGIEGNSMNNKARGFTIMELILVILILIILFSVVTPFAQRYVGRIMSKSRAAADAVTLHTTLSQVSEKLMEGRTMQDITSSMAPVECQLDPDAELWVNYSKPVTLEVYFVNGDKFYSLDYLTEVAVAGTSGHSLKKPFTLGFWFQLGVGKINEYEKR